MLWYAAYGSNQSWARFRAYLRGGLAPGATRPNAGARDPADPVAIAPCWLEHRLLFAESSRIWGGGGVAFVDPAPGSGRTPGRRYLITESQFQDVHAQECGRPVGDEIDLSVVTFPGSLVVGDRRYDRIVAVDRVDGVPVVTFTTPLDTAELAVNEPAAGYLATIVAGVVEGHGVTEPHARAMVAAARCQQRSEALGPSGSGGSSGDGAG